ncbi:MAG: phospholipid/cholesterol/gamma-HCH transport system substrate-binding protein [Solirubrobacterales bacterium]|nr:phospholipid/cholesterol/gamma-HCH transport system substrate-binding protein [Solirubrobacterales bacterium]
MKGRSAGATLAASPTMVGAVTTLILIVAVFLAYNANNGLPFVPVYSVSVDVPNAARLGNNNEVRIGGTRVGVVESIEPVEIENGESASTDGDSSAGDVPELGARLNLKLDKAAEPLPEDSVFRVRYRSTFGLKYLEIVRGTGPDAEEGHIFDGTNDGDAAECDIPTTPATFSEDIPEQAKDGCFQEQTEFDAINNTFDNKTRSAARENLLGFGGAFAGRGASLNDAIEGLRPLVENLGPVSRVLSDPSTQLERFISSLARTAEIVAPVSDEQAQFFTNAAIAFDAFTRDTGALQDTISEGPPTLDVAIDTLPRQRPFLAEFAELSRRLRPGVQDLRVALPVLNRAIDVGTPVLARTPQMNRDLRDVLVELDRLIKQESTVVTLQRLRDTFDSARRFSEWVVPAQTVCNYWNYWFSFLPEALSDEDQVGFNFRQALTNSPPGPNALNIGPVTLTVPGETHGPVAGYSGIQATGKHGPVPNPLEDNLFDPEDQPIVHGNPYGPTGQDGSDCQGGQSGYLLGELRIPGQPVSNPSVAVADIPGDRGPTTLYYDENGDRTFRDTRVPSRQP